MTREEVKRKIAGDPEAERITSKHNDFIIDKVFDYFEQRNAELEQRVKELKDPKTCDGCKHFFEDDFAGCKLYEKDFTRCSRQFENDYYEPK